jgi:catechol 2,3-dioxygenase-like lactoylglutathione lyase family enzyme
LVTDIDHVQLAAPKGCETEARRFFSDLLGLQEIEKPAALRQRGGCWFRIGSKQLHIGVEEPFRPATKAHPAFSVSDIDSAFQLLEQHGVRCAWDEALLGIRRFYANDPWGNRLEFTQPTSSI